MYQKHFWHKERLLFLNCRISLYMSRHPPHTREGSPPYLTFTHRLGIPQAASIHVPVNSRRRTATRLRGGLFSFIWVWVKIKAPGYRPQVLVLLSIYQGKPFGGYPIFDHDSFISLSRLLSLRVHLPHKAAYEYGNQGPPLDVRADRLDFWPQGQDLVLGYPRDSPENTTCLTWF